MKTPVRIYSAWAYLLLFETYSQFETTSR